MKNVLLFIFVSLMFLTGASNMNNAFLDDEKAGMENVLQKETSTGYVLSSVVEWPEQGPAYVDFESLVGQFRILGRGQRSFSVQHVFPGKVSAYRMAKKHLDILSHSIYRIYTSLPRQSWAVSSLHYVFELRHILI